MDTMKSSKLHLTTFRQLSALALFLWIVFGSSTVFATEHPVTNRTELLADQKRFLPIGDLAKQAIVLITPSTKKYDAFIQQASRYAPMSSYSFSDLGSAMATSQVILVVAARKELRSDVLSKLRTYAAKGKAIIFCEIGGNSYNLPIGLTADMIHLRNPENTLSGQRALAMSVFGGLPITSGMNKRVQIRLRYDDGGADLPGLNLVKMTRKIDAIAEEAMKEQAAPGMVVMVVKNGAVLLEKAYGYHTYAKAERTMLSDIFDLASVSKIAATTPLIMHLYETKQVQLDSTLGFYLPAARGTNKAKTSLRTILLHEGGFEPYIPFYRDLKPGDLQRQASSTHGIQLADHAFLRNNYYEQVMWPRMLASPIKDAGKYVYSDISMYAMKEVAEQVTHEGIEQYLQDWLYRRIGMQTTGYNPRKRFPKNRLVPTENDTTFRKELLQGYVHDQGAAMAKGVAGHAGLFASANDLAIYGQMLLNRGTYGGVRYFQPTTVDLFTSRQSLSSRRGLGFDRYDMDASKAYPSRFANESVFGHTGFTGTCLWVDPKHQLVYIFLSNRVYPDVSDKLYDLNIRSRIQDAVYETINEAK
ncbi:serine hydrolase [Sphingobacterium sp. lm-10]|uniref:serine hydrolase domain-containing protein n=1 Tax=Sphingobacterium sp. lm-10 TaxID=2944904 RepID=UPI0020207D5E|nr:serine hydrolase [Sphingobacterium sp. lm-10]MCL7988385.1 serine hydrolase [Sphingobacterium sp. lm-10]